MNSELEHWSQRFREAQFSRPERAAASWVETKRRLPRDSPFLAHWAEAWGLVLQAADPELAFGVWSRWVEADLDEAEAAGVRAVEGEGSGEKDDAGRYQSGRRAARWASSRHFREGFIGLAGASPALGERLLNAWGEFQPEAWQSGWETRSSLIRRVGVFVEGSGEREFLDRVRSFQQVEGLRIAYLDCLQDLPVDLVTLQISSLADAVIAACYERAALEVARRRGVVPPAGGFAVFALGKLGGLELNYSSDVDLLFLYDDGLAVLEGRNRKGIEDPHDIERFFTLVAERIVHLVTAFTDRGQLYRLDARLRPGGASGRLVWSARAAVDYYYSQGRAWERQALIRLRPIAGDFGLAERFRSDLDAFVFPAALSARDISEIRGLKLQMEKLAEDRGPREPHLKVGHGGIRDVEYIVQFLQLVHASRIPALKAANVFKALESLDLLGLLKPEETDVLRRGYRFLRRVEHRLQMMNLLQTHRVPGEPRELSRLARGLGFASVEAFHVSLRVHADAIRRVYRLLFAERTAARAEAEELPALLELPLEAAAEPGARLLVPYGFQDPKGAFQRLRALAGVEVAKVTLDAPRSKQVFAQLHEKLLREVSRHPQPDRTLQNFEECVRTLGARSVFYQLLDESERVLQLFVEICARTSFVVDTLRARPDLFDEVVDALLTGYTFSRQSLIDLVERLLDAPATFTGEVFRLKHMHLLLIAIRDLDRLDNLSTTLLRISELAEALLHGLLRAALAEARARFGEWRGAAPRFLFLGLGKLAGQEMNYKSDVDMVLLYDAGGTAGRRAGGVTDRGITAEEYFERLSQMLLERAAQADSAGPLLRVDLRLRPLGNHNSLAISCEAWRQYFLSGQARTWERQAFLRARPVAGDEALAGEAMDFVRRELVLGGAAGPPSEGAVRDDVWAMRRRLEAHAPPGSLKRGEGGIMDVEFLVQTLQLLHGKEHPHVLTPNTAEGLVRLMEAGILGAHQGSELLTAYQFLRWLENRLALVSEAGQSLDSVHGLEPGELDSLIQKIGYKSSGEESARAIFLSELEYYRRKNRFYLLRILNIEEN